MFWKGVNLLHISMLLSIYACVSLSFLLLVTSKLMRLQLHSVICIILTLLAYTYTAAMASTSSTASSTAIPSTGSDNSNGSQLLLEAAPPASGPHSADELVRKLDLSNGPASLSLGPLVVHEDGTLSRVQNWDTMTPGERETTMRVLVARNRRRLDRLREAEAEKEQAEKEKAGHKEL